MIDELNKTVWCTLASSTIHGIGVFAIRDIPKGQKIYATSDDRKWLIETDFNGLHPAIKRLIAQRWPHAFKGNPFLSPNSDARLLSFMNGSDTPNYDFETDTALVDIPAGTELTEDYSSMPELKMV